MSVFQELYDSEINFVVSTFWDAGFDWKLGDEMNGFKAGGCCHTMADVEKQLAKAAVEHFPRSVFTLNKGKGA